MKIEIYKAQFAEFTEQAMKLSYESRIDLQQKITKLSCEAVEFYKENSDCKASDYQLRIEVFLEFDNLLKCIKKDFLSQAQEKKGKFFFTNLKQIKQDDSYESIPSLDNSITL